MKVARIIVRGVTRSNVRKNHCSMPQLSSSTFRNDCGKETNARNVHRGVCYCDNAYLEFEFKIKILIYRYFIKRQQYRISIFS